MTAMTTVPLAATDGVHADAVDVIGSQLAPTIAPDVPLITAQEVLLGSAAVLAPRPATGHRLARAFRFVTHPIAGVSAPSAMATETKAAHRNPAVDHSYLQSSRMSREMYRL